MRRDSKSTGYLSNIYTNRVLSEQEIIELAKRIAKGDEDALNDLVCSHLGLVPKVVSYYIDKKRIPDTVDLDLIQEGNIGLMIAAKKWDYKRKVPFVPFAINNIKYAILSYITKYLNLVNLTSEDRQKLNKLNELKMKYLNEYYKEPTIEELAAYSDAFTLKELKKLENNSLVSYAQSLDEEFSNGGNLYDVLPSNTANEDDYVTSRKKMLDNVTPQLPKRSQTIIKMMMNEAVKGVVDIRRFARKYGYSIIEVDDTIERAREIIKTSTDKLKNN